MKYKRKGDPNTDDHVEFTLIADDGTEVLGFCDFCGYYTPNKEVEDNSNGRLWRTKLVVNGKTTYLGNRNAKFNWESVSTAVLNAYIPKRREKNRKELEEWREKQRAVSPYYAEYRERERQRKIMAELRNKMDEEYRRVVSELEWESKKG